MRKLLATMRPNVNARLAQRVAAVLIGGLLWPVFASAQNCPNVGNLVGNCGFNQNVTGYSGQEPGDVVAHEPVLGDTAAGSMRVTDTAADGDDVAEAETCVNLPAGRDYAIGASFRAVAANECFVGFDEHVGPNCGAPNGFFSASPTIAVSNGSFQRFSINKTVAAGVASIELVMLCTRSDAGSTVFLVDDVFVLAGLANARIFGNGFEVVSP